MKLWNNLDQPVAVIIKIHLDNPQLAKYKFHKNKDQDQSQSQNQVIVS